MKETNKETKKKLARSSIKTNTLPKRSGMILAALPFRVSTDYGNISTNVTSPDCLSGTMIVTYCQEL